MKWTAGLFATSLVLAGCAGPAWYRPDVTEARVEQDSRECDRLADHAARAEGKPSHQALVAKGAQQAQQRRADHEEKYAACMKERGYTATDARG